MKQESKMLKEIEKILNENKEVLTEQFKVEETYPEGGYIPMISNNRRQRSE